MQRDSKISKTTKPSVIIDCSSVRIMENSIGNFTIEELNTTYTSYVLSPDTESIFTIWFKATGTATGFWTKVNMAKV